MARQRKSINKELPSNLYSGTNGHYKYRRSDTGKWHSMGSDKERAIAAAKRLNLILFSENDLVKKVIYKGNTLNDFLDEFESRILKERELSEKTLTAYKHQLVHIRNNLGWEIVDRISVKEIAVFLKQFPVIHSNRYRSLLNMIFKYAVANGLSNQNPVEKTIPNRTHKKRRRLTIEGYYEIYSHKEAKPWLQNAMDIALQTLQRCDDVVKIKFSDIQEGYLYTIQGKTKKHGKSAHLKIKIEVPLKKIISRCRDNILSPYLIHRMPERFIENNTNAKTKDHCTQLLPDYLSKAFSEIRDKLSMFNDLPVEERPTFHEIRSLGIKLYEEQGVDAQALAGHKTRAMTDKYKEGHKIEWTETKAGLDLQKASGTKTVS